MSNILLSKYLISIRENGIKISNHSRNTSTLYKTFGLVKEISCSLFSLYSEGENERLYIATRSRIKPFQKKELEQIQSLFKKENKIIDVAKLEEII